MKNKFAFALLLPGLILFATIAGCNGGGYSPPPPPPPVLSVSISTTSGQVEAGSNAMITAQVNNDTSGKGVTWSISPGSGAGTLTNETTTSATYNAPKTPPAADVQVTITATSVADPTQSASVIIDFPAIFVSLAASVNPVEACPTQPCPAGTSLITATVSFDPANKGVDPSSWTISPASGAGTLSGQTSTTVIYTAPAAFPPSDVPVTITATSVSDKTKQGSVQVTFAAIAVSVTPNPVTVAEDTSQQFTGTVSFDPSGQGVNWTLTQGAPPVACSPACGTISAPNSPSGTPITYNAPSVVPTPNTVTLTATSISDATKSGSSTINVVNPDSALKGQYAFLFHGFDDATGKQVAVAGSFTADGFGNITGGEEDINGPAGPQTLVTFTGTYIVGLDNRGTATITNSLPGNVTYAFSLGSINAGVATKVRFIEFDDNNGTTGTRGSGTMRLQDPAALSPPNIANIKGSYGFGISGQDSGGGRLASAGIFSADGAGNITSGTEDTNDTGTVTNTANFTGTYTAPDATNGRSTGALSSGTHFSLYVVSASEAFLLTTDVESTAGLQSGNMLLQASTPYSNSSLNATSVFYEVGVNAASPTTKSRVQIGLFTGSGSGGLTILSDENNGGTITANSTANGLMYSVDANGRVTITGGAGTPPILYLVDNNKAFLLGADASVGFGFLEPQSGAPFGAFSLHGNFFFGVAPPAVTASTVSSGLGIATNSFSFFRRVFHSLHLIQDSSSSNGTLSSGASAFSAFSVFPNGRTTNANTSVIYLISPSKFVRIDEVTGDVTPTVSIFEQ